MKTCKRWLALLLSVLMLASVLPVSAVAVNSGSATKTATEVIYNLQDLEVTVGSDAQKASEGLEPYVLFDADGSYTIEINEPNPLFPYEVQFKCGGETTTAWFVTPEDTVEIGGHTFRVAVSSEPTMIGLYVGEDYVPAYPAPKTFSNGYGIAPMSLLPLEEKTLTVDLRAYLPEELKQVRVDALLPGIQLSGDETVVWAKRYDSEGKTSVVNLDETIDLSPDSYYQTSQYLELIVGKADQLDTSNIRYIVNLWTCYLADVFAASAQTTQDPPEQMDVFGLSLGGSSNQRRLYITLDGTKWSYGQDALLRLDLAQGVNISDLTACIYEGYYMTSEAAQEADAKDITAQIWGADAEGYLIESKVRPEITIVLMRGDKLACVQPFEVCLTASHESISFGWLYTEMNSGSSYSYRTEVDRSYTYDPHDHLNRTFTMNRGYPANGEYYFNLQMTDDNPNTDDGNCGINLVDSAYEGNFATKQEAEGAGAADIKAQLFSRASSVGGGYLADYSQGVQFTIFSKIGEVYHASVKTIDYVEELPDGPDPLSADTYFRMQDALLQAGETTQTLNAYVMPYDDDSYYYNGYQTVFLLTQEKGAVAEGSNIVPLFYTGDKVSVFAGLDNSSGIKQESGKTAITFASGKAVQYSAAAENGTHLKNYWVTFLTQQEGAKLFVNGATNSAHIDEETGLPVREVFLDNAHGNHHDIFFSNIGDSALTGLYARLEDAQNVQLDPYWTIGATTTLSPFTDTIGYQYNRDNSYASYGELQNVAKIRLIPTESKGTISGTLTIGSENGGEVKIKLTGVSGVPKITTTSVVDGVKYVPYSSVIQTNNMYEENAVRFSLDSGTLPAGLEIKPNGEIYGVPQEYGEFTFTVKAIYHGDESLSDTAEYTLKILDNTNGNVWESTDNGYEVAEAIGVLNDNQGVWTWVLEEYTDELFWTEGSFSYFIDFWLDGQKLVRGKDYLAEEGSTKITILEQTLRRAGGGTHTIAAEFREGDQKDGALKRAAQNYTVKLVSSNPVGPANPTSSSQSKPNGTDKNQRHPVFVDVFRPDWFYGDVDWAYEQRLMVGVGNNRFAPQNKITAAMVVTTLARMSKVDLTNYENYAYLKKYPDIQANQWFTLPAIWAKETGILTDTPFDAASPLPRADFALILVRYLDYIGVDVTLPENPRIFADADQMTQEELEAFQLLKHFGIFNGFSGNQMMPNGETTRAQLAALLHRLSVFVESTKEKA